jgi:hypothetical protein
MLTFYSNSTHHLHTFYSPHVDVLLQLVTLLLLGGGIRTKVGTSSYFETFKQEWPSYFLLWAATKTCTGRLYAADAAEAFPEALIWIPQGVWFALQQRHH